MVDRDLANQMLNEAVGRHGLEANIPDPDFARPAWATWATIMKPAPRIELDDGSVEFGRSLGRDLRPWLLPCRKHFKPMWPIQNEVPAPVAVPVVVMRRTDWADPLPDGAGHRLFACFVGQCPTCRTIYWGTADLGVCPALGIG